MSTNAQRAYSELGQSIWYDNVQRAALRDGTFAKLIADGVRGCTSNPTIFHQAISGSDDYDPALVRLVSEGKSRDEIYYALIAQDIRDAADALSDVYAQSEQRDGFISVEVQPRSAHNADATVEEAVDLWRQIDRPNLMIKVPATDAGMTAISELIARGISVNVTLIFSRKQYRQVHEAYLRGLERARANSLELSRIASVASFFVSRIDAKVDAWLEDQIERGHHELSGLLGKVAIANAKAAYQHFQSTCSGDRFAALANAGATPQRLLWASTGTKNPEYPDTLYVDELLGPQTVNTLPPATYQAFQDHASLESKLTRDVQTASEVLTKLEHAGLSLERVCDELLVSGLKGFADSFDSLMAVLDQRRQALRT